MGVGEVRREGGEWEWGGGQGAGALVAVVKSSVPRGARALKETAACADRWGPVGPTGPQNVSFYYYLNKIFGIILEMQNRAKTNSKYLTKNPADFFFEKFHMVV